MSKNTSVVLIVDDDSRLRNLLRIYLEGKKYEVYTAKSAQEARLALEDCRVDVIIADVMMPEESGIEFTKKLRETSAIPVLMLTAMSEVEDRIEGLESGADDYLSKPFEPRELVLRIENLLSRMNPTQKHDLITFGEFSFSVARGELRKNGKFIDLTSKEITLLAIFSASLDKLVSRENLSKQLNGISERSIDVQVNRLRKKIEDDSKKPYHLITAWGVGYVLRSREI